jgi:hypothetical protein
LGGKQLTSLALVSFSVKRDAFAGVRSMARKYFVKANTHSIN